MLKATAEQRNNFHNGFVAAKAGDPKVSSDGHWLAGYRTGLDSRYFDERQKQRDLEAAARP